MARPGPAFRRAAATLSVLVLGCTVDDLDVSGMACPCPTGFDCDNATRTCVRVSATVATGTGAAGGAGGGAGGGTGGGAPCPADMVHASDGQNVSFCIDRHEVTQSAYVQFLASVGDTSGIEQPPACAFNTTLTHTPDDSCPSFTTSNELPVWCVDWCDAHAFCKWSSKRLCGKIGGGSLMPLNANVNQEEWYFACSRGYQREYPYGSDGIPGACNIPEENTSTPDDDNDKAIVESYSQCQGGFDGIFDMQGNVTEWTDWCESAGDGTGTEACRLRGGHTFGTAEYWSCDNVAESEPRNREDRREGGFRCCKDAGP